MFKSTYFDKLIKPNKTEEIKYLEANKNQTIIFFNDGRIIKSTYTLLNFEKLLKQKSQLKRIHKSYIVNMNNVVTIEVIGGYLKIKSGEALPINSRYFK